MGEIVLPRQYRLPSVKSSFARSASESAYPQLWHGLEFAFVPAMSVFGDLRDIVGNRVLSLQPSNGYKILEGELIADCATNFLEGQSFQLRNSSPTAVSLVSRCRFPSDSTLLIEVNDTSGVNRGVNFFRFSDSLSFRGIRGGQQAGSYTPASFNDFHTFAGVFRAQKGLVSIYEDGFEQHNSSFTAGTFDNLPFDTLNVWRAGGWGTFDGDMASLLFWTRELTDAEIRLLGRDHIAPFRLRPQWFSIPSEPSTPQITGSSTSTIDTDGSADVSAQLGGATTSTVDTDGLIDVLQNITGSSTGLVGTAGTLDSTLIQEIEGATVSTVETEGEFDVEGPEQITGSSVSTVQTLGAADVVAQLGGSTVSTVDTLGEAETRPQIIGDTVSTIGTAGEPDTVSPEQITGSTISTVQTLGAGEIVQKILGDTVSTVHTLGEPDVTGPPAIIGSSVGLVATAGAPTIVEQVTGSVISTIETQGAIPVGIFDPVNSRIATYVKQRGVCKLPAEGRNTTLQGP